MAPNTCTLLMMSTLCLYRPVIASECLLYIIAFPLHSDLTARLRLLIVYYFAVDNNDGTLRLASHNVTSCQMP
jgi:hypothetical protein